MKVHTVIRKGSDHAVFCEDFLIKSKSGRFFLGAVFDGCSGGDDSHFASSLQGKVFRQVNESGALFGNTLEELAKEFMRKFVRKMFDVRVALELQDNDMLATFMMIIYDTVKGEALTMTIGDGIICCDGEITILENDRFKDIRPEVYMNMPDYISYDLVELGFDKGLFDVWFDRRVTITKFIDPQDISIATDGLLTFNSPVSIKDKKGVVHEPVDILNYLLIDDTWMKNDIMLSKKVNILRTLHKTVHKDDISIIRLIPNFKEDDSSDSEAGED